MVTLVIGMVTLLLALGLTFLPVPGIPMFSAPLMTVRAIIVAVGLVIWWEVWRRRGQEVRTDDSRITWSPRHDREVTMPWSQVHAVRERLVLRRLELFDGSHQSIPLSYDLPDFGELLPIVHRNTPHLRERHLAMRTFRRHPSTQWLYLASTLGFVALLTVAIVQRERLGVVVFLGASIIGVLAYGRTVRTIEIVPAGLTLTTPFGSRQLAWRDVVGVELMHAWGGGGFLEGAVPLVRIRLRSGKRIDLGAIVEGTIALFDAVEAAWKRGETARTDQVIA
jgi:Bacterial PH domain